MHIHVIGTRVVWHGDEPQEPTDGSIPFEVADFPGATMGHVLHWDGRSWWEEVDCLDAGEVLAALFAAEPANLDVLPDEALARMAPYMEPWEPDAAYRAGDKRQYADLPYRCLQAHTSQESWNPADAPSLWAKVLIPDPSVIPEWEQPGSTNPYMKGDKVKYNGKTWVSDVDNNVWEPGVYGWTEVE